MKNTLLALSLFASSGLFADCCCEPKPRKCIHDEAFNPAYSRLQCDAGFSIEADFLYWFARENNMPYALEVGNEDAKGAVTVR